MFENFNVGGCGSPPSALPGISPSRGRSAGRYISLHTQPRMRAGSSRLSISPLEGEMSGRTEGGKPHPRHLTAKAPE
ncbi:hypothetical protein F3P66_22005 [Agrobacterium fabrum]|nr:hypothetical protein F3P66_22005 [Agrobacterium fabrum]